MYFAPGQTVLRRCWRGGRISFLQVTQVVEDGPQGLPLWLPMGTPYWRIESRDGRDHHHGTIDQLGADAVLRPRPWAGNSLLIWQAPGEPWSVWWFLDRGTEFTGWYGNLEEPGVRWDDGAVRGVDFADNALDLLIAADRSWRWKDEDELAAKTGHPRYWDGAGADRIRADGRRLAERARSGEFPFDGTWCDFRPDPSWPRPDGRAAGDVPELTAGWHRPRAVRADGSGTMVS